MKMLLILPLINQTNFLVILLNKGEMIGGFIVNLCGCQILCNTVSNTVETKIQHNTGTASNGLAGKKTNKTKHPTHPNKQKTLCLVSIFVDGRKKILICFFIFYAS